MKHDNRMTGISRSDFLGNNRVAPAAKKSEDQNSRATLPPRFDIVAAEIDCVVQIFYAAIRRHEVLGPIFAAHVTDWPMHEAKTADFWKKAILHRAGYDEHPMRAHILAGNVKPVHFRLWLNLFDDTLNSVLSPVSAAAWSSLAHRIGRGLRIGVEDMRNTQLATPLLP